MKHTEHCKKRKLYGDGECECSAVASESALNDLLATASRYYAEMAPSEMLPFCNSCKEADCCVSFDGTCEMIRVYLSVKSN